MFSVVKQIFKIRILSDLLQFRKACKHLLHTDFVEINRNLLIPATLSNILHDTNAEFHMAYRISHAVVQAGSLGNCKILLLQAAFCLEIHFHLGISTLR